ncbi:Putative WD40/YVTN repeat-like-containing domain superfamily [Septoria linicola]|uniref:WD40/YVTN repeat-like-containing domain superfamily n=1 Tax=Septoria linicola TaxID=215465 RepID=A0A9Q9B030_9PEZI|nr:putative WD40/YVTN repeat-like-containing domain superfamily [Septoria linicola]USW59212.1 Putative WD40/YVTN repeat-like-containing domain superfamily [Septoria linicola]
MEPRIAKRERKLHLSYDLPHRIHTTHVYPVTAPNGSTLIIYGHERGLRILWRGGRRRKQQHSSIQTIGAQSDTIDLISDDEDTTKEKEPFLNDQYEADEEEQDPDCPYPSIIQDIDIEFGDTDTPKAALRVAIPAINATTVPVRLLKTTAIVAVACSDGKVAILSIPLAIPTDDEKEQYIQDVADSTVTLQNAGPIPADLTIKYLPAEQQPLTARQNDDVDGHLLVASVSRALHVWSVEVTGDIILAISDNKLLRRAPLPAVGSKVSFHPSNRRAQLLVVDTSGSARIYDPHASHAPARRPGSSDSMLSNQTTSNSRTTGKWLTAYHTPFHIDQESTTVSAACARRKAILDAKWALSGKAIFVLLEDGEWGWWDTASIPAGKRVEEFVIRGFLGTAGHSEAAEPVKQRKGLSKLAPMTPNTRKTKEEQLFTAAPKVPGVAPHGGISISSQTTRTGPSDESAVLWYNTDIYSINSLQSFYQRSTSNSGGLGSLYSPGLTHITDINLVNEAITSLSQFSSKASSAGIGNMNTQRDLVVSAERRVIILQNLRPAVPSRQLFQKQLAERPTAVDHDQHMLDAGNLDIDGMDRLLDNMAGVQNNRAAPARRVGFVAALG